jgi:HK97 family phage major capsid protein
MEIRQFKIVAKANEAEIFLYDQIGTSFFGEGISAKQFAEQFRAIGKVSRVVLRINSPGGDVFDGAAIYDLIKESDVPVDVAVDGIAASAAFTIAMAGRKISVGEAGMMMMHNAKAMAMGDAEDMRHTADAVEKVSDQMAAIYARRSGLSLADVKTLMDAETWMMGQECVAKGFADVCVPEKEEDDMAARMGAAFDLSKFTHVPASLKFRIAAFVGSSSRTKRVDGENLTSECFLYVGDETKTDTWHLPWRFSSEEKTVSHLRDALARFDQTDIPESEKPKVKAKLVRLCKEHGITVSEEPTARASLAKSQEIQNTAQAGKVGKMETNTAAAAVEVDNYNQTASEITDLCVQFNCTDRLSEILKAKTSLVEAKMVVTDIVLARAKKNAAENPAGLAQPTVASLTSQERSDYSLCRAIRSLAGESGCEATLEREVSADIAKRIGKSTSGMFIPTNLNPFRPRASGLDEKTNAGGKYTVMTEVRDLIELLRNKARVIQLGATVLSGLTSNIQFPTQASAGTIYWTGDNPGSNVTQADLTFGARTMTPHVAQATTAFSRQLLAQSTVDVEGLVREDLAKVHALGVDAAAISGTGNSNQPLGLLGTTGIGSVAMGTNGAKPTYASCCDLETSIATANADEDGMKFLTTPGMRGVLKKVGKLDSTYASIPLWDQWGNAPGIGDLIGYQAFVSNQVPSNLTKGTTNGTCHAIIFGYWPTLVVGEWGVLELIVDPYSLKKQGMIEVTSFQMVDVMLRQPAQMAAIQDATLT